MKVALFAEGKSDLAVLKNILKGWLDIDGSDISFQRPDLHYDNTDLSQMAPEQHSNWTLVKQDCIDGTKMQTFLDSNPEAFIVIQIDAFECDHIGYGVQKPNKGKDALVEYSEALRQKIIVKIEEWLAGRFAGQKVCAVAIEETEAWLLPLYDSRNTDTSYFPDPKAALNRVISADKKFKNLTQVFDRFDKLSNEFRKKKNLVNVKSKNRSLELFLEDLEMFRPLVSRDL